MFQKRALVVGSTGIVGLNVLEHLRDLGDWQIDGLSRRPPSGASYMQSHAVDLLDAAQTKQVIATLEPTHIY